MCDNIVEILKEEIISFFSSIGIDIKSVSNWHSVFFIDFDNPSYEGHGEWFSAPLKERLSITITDKISLGEILEGKAHNRQEETIDFALNRELPCGKRLQPLGYKISTKDLFQLVFLSDSWDPTSPISYEYETYYFDYFDCLGKENKIHRKKGNILIHTFENLEEGDEHPNIPPFTNRIETNRLVSGLQLKSKVPEIQAWIEEQIASI